MSVWPNNVKKKNSARSKPKKSVKCSKKKNVLSAKKKNNRRLAKSKRRKRRSLTQARLLVVMLVVLWRALEGLHRQPTPANTPRKTKKKRKKPIQLIRSLPQSRLIGRHGKKQNLNCRTSWITSAKMSTSQTVLRSSQSSHTLRLR